MRAGPGGKGESFKNSNSESRKFQEVRKISNSYCYSRGPSSFGKPLCTMWLPMTLWRWINSGAVANIVALRHKGTRTAVLTLLRAFMQISLGLTADVHREQTGA